MAKTSKQNHVPKRPEDWELNAKPLPIGQAEIDQAWSFIVRHHDAVMAGDVAGSANAIKGYDDLVAYLNGGTRFGSYGSDDRPGPYLLKKLAAKDGDEPLWGQAGVFFVHAMGMPAIVEYGGNQTLSGHMAFRAAALGQRFVSDTGYISHFINPYPAKRWPGRTVKQAAEESLQLLQQERKKHAKISIEEMRFNRYYQLDWVKQGLALMQDGNPRPGQHVRLKANGEYQVGLVVELAEANVPPGNIMVALMTGKSNSRSVPGIITGAVPVSHVKVMTHDQLVKESSLGRYLTPAMVEAYVATQTVFTGEKTITEYCGDSNYGWRFKTQ